MNTCCLSVLFLFLFVGTVNAQQHAKIIEQRLAWAGADVRMRVTSKADIRAQLENRRYIFPDRLSQHMSRVAYEYDLGKSWRFSAGLGFFILAQPQNPKIIDFVGLPEWRPFIDLFTSQPLSSKFTLSHRYRSEQRFMRNYENGELANGYRHFMNVRYRITLEALVKGDGKAPGSLSMFVYDEIFFQAGEGVTYNIFDQNRIAGGFNYRLSKNCALDLSYINWYQQRPANNEFYYRHIVRAVLRATLDFRKSEAIKL